MQNEPTGRVALVTGASSGIGRATALVFARAGYAVAMADVAGPDGQHAVEEVKAAGGRATFIRCDVCDPVDVLDAVDQTVRQFGRLDAAFNNAGIEGDVASTGDCSHDNWERVIAVNLTGVWLCMRNEIHQMLKQDSGGVIVNCASVAGLTGIAGMPAYVASKHGVVGLTKVAALDYAEKGIRVNAVCPGAIQTPMLDRFMGSSEEARRTVLANEPVGRLGTPDEIAKAVLWLCGPDSSFVTGQALAVDGGWTAR